jgi:hypothetical protein
MHTTAIVGVATAILGGHDVTLNGVDTQLLSDLRSIPTQEEIARQLHSGAGTLKRQLEREGTNFRSLVAETRESMAKELLRTERPRRPRRRRRPWTPRGG